MSNRSDNGAIARICCFVALVLAALIILIGGVNSVWGMIFDGKSFIDGKVQSVLEMVKDIALLIGIFFGAKSWAYSHGTVAKAFFWVSIIIYVVCVILKLF